MCNVYRMPYNFFSSMRKIWEDNLLLKPQKENVIVPDTLISKSPQLKKVKSEEDFVKFQVPWIL